jgi:hypothetical protein
LKELFISAPILAYWDSDKPTVLKADCSEYSMGAVTAGAVAPLP